MTNISIDEMSESQAKDLLNEIADIFGIGEKVPAHCLKTNIGNCKRFSENLHAVEREFFMVAGEPDEDYPDDEPEQECLVNSWGSSQEEYIEQFRSALKVILNANESTPEIEEAFPVVLYLGSEEDREELIQAVMEVKPNMKSRKL